MTGFERAGLIRIDIENEFDQLDEFSDIGLIVHDHGTEFWRILFHCYMGYGASAMGVKQARPKTG